MHKELIAAASALVLMTGTAFAQSSTGNPSTGSPSTSTPMGTPSTTMQRPGMAPGSQTLAASSEKLLGKNVYGKDNEKIGAVEDIILDPQSGQATHIIVSSGGFLGIGEKKVALDYDKATWNEADNRLQVSTLSRDDVKNMNEFQYSDTMTSLNKHRSSPLVPMGTTPKQ